MLKQEKFPPLFNVIDRAGHYISRLGIETPNLDAQHIREAAMKQTGLSDFGHPHYAEGLAVFVDAAKRDGLTYLGRATVREIALGYAINRLEWVAMQKNSPEIFTTELVPPLILLGLPRSGTTFLHRLLASDPAHQAVPQWRLLKPFPPQNGSRDNRYKQTKRILAIANRMRPKLSAKHALTVDSPEECMMVQGLSFNSFMLYASVPVTSYLDWYIKADRLTMYQEYASILQWYQSQDPRRLVLKSPTHTSELHNIQSTIPNALLVQTHRDPVKVVNSLNSLLHTVHTPAMKSYTPHKMVENTLKLIDLYTNENLSVRQQTPLNICDIYYEDLVDDPIGTVQQIYEHFNLTWTEPFEQKLRQYISENPRGKHGAHSYTSADFDLTDAQIQERYANYIQRFNLHHSKDL